MRDGSVGFVVGALLSQNDDAVRKAWKHGSTQSIFHYRTRNHTANFMHCCGYTAVARTTSCLGPSAVQGIRVRGGEYFSDERLVWIQVLSSILLHDYCMV